jgi:glycosyltransferase involved in cell wall biosynthesis
VRILFVSHGFPPHQEAGVEIYTAALADSLARSGDEPYVFASSYTSDGAVDAEEMRGSVPVRRFFVPRRQVRLRFHDDDVERAFLDHLDAVRPDVVHVQHLHSVTVPLISVVVRRGIPVVLSLHDFWFLCPAFQRYSQASHPLRGRLAGLDCYAHLELRPRMLAGMIVRRTFVRRARLHLERARLMRGELAAANAIVVPSRFVWSRFASAGVDLSRASLISHGIEALSKTERSIANTGVRVGYLGGIVRSKGVDLLARAFNAIDEPTASLELCGPEIDPAFARRIRRIAARDPRVSLHPPIPHVEVGRFLAGIDVLVVPSRLDESFSIVAREALAANVPVVASDSGALSEVVEPGQNGLLFQRGNAHDLQRKLEPLVREPRRIATLRTGSHVKTMDEHAREIRDVYQRVRQPASAVGRDPSGTVGSLLK